VPDKNNNPIDSRRLRKASWLALALLALLQITLVSHQFDHVAAYLGDTCQVCVQLDRVGDTAVDQPESLPASSGRHVETRRPIAAVASTPVVRHFDSRAPPAI